MVRANIKESRLLEQIKFSYTEVYELEKTKKKLSRAIKEKKHMLTNLLEFLREK